MAPEYSAYIVPGPKEDFKLVKKALEAPPHGHVLIKVKACGICPSDDSYCKTGTWPGVSYPRVPGHEIGGVVDAVGEGVTAYKPGDRVGVGWEASQCKECRSCLEGRFPLCGDQIVMGIHLDGGYGEYVTVPVEGVAPIPDGLTFQEAAAMMCGGTTVYNALRHAAALPGDIVAIQGIGGLGHLAVQFAAKMGYKVIAVSRGADKAVDSQKLGAVQYIDSTKEDPVEVLQAMGGAKLVLSTVTNAPAMSSMLQCLDKQGELLVIGAPKANLEVSALFLIVGSRAVRGWQGGCSTDAGDALKFAALTGVRPMIEVFPASKVADAFNHAVDGKAKYRAVIDWELEEK